ncbi:MAG: hypothetical protein PHD51_01780 [Patescibacteria group bacterium]|nr:hypothetical protein [Patescibacteria group bacterium]MDD5490407.1 hypothetical protein [Patescibacteria group bacterium]
MNRLKNIIFGVIFIILAGAVAVLVFLYAVSLPLEKQPLEWGVSFSWDYAKYLGLNWQEAYLAVLDDLKVKWVRIPVYWDDLELKEENFNFSKIDWQVSEASKRGVNIQLAIGLRLPRWPECRAPGWWWGLGEKERQDKILTMLREIVERYKREPALKYWQVENEPFLDVFGECPRLDKKFFEEEVKLVKSLDGTRPVVVTDSGELSSWRRIAKISDILGVSMYRVVWNKRFGYFEWFVPPSFYRIKAYLVRNHVQKVINTELQLEPWLPSGSALNTPLSEQKKSMNLEQMRKNVRFAEEVGFSPTFIWGAEWWYWMKNIKEDASFWEEGRRLWQ